MPQKEKPNCAPPRKPQIHLEPRMFYDDPSLESPLRRAVRKVAASDWSDYIPYPRPKSYEERPEMVGQKVTVRRCKAREHGDNEGCLCDLIGEEVEISGIYESPFVGTPSYHIKSSTKRIQEREWVKVEKKYEDGELERVCDLLSGKRGEEAQKRAVEAANLGRRILGKEGSLTAEELLREIEELL